MYNKKYVFSQLLDALDRNGFNYLVRKYEGDKYVKQFACYNLRISAITTNLQSLCSGNFPIVKVFVMSSWQPKHMHPRLIILGSASPLQKATCQRPITIVTIASSRSLLIFFTNALDISPMMVAELYHQRWQIELFFMWLKQHLKIKKFWGETENAIRIQIYSAITAYVMMAIVQKKMGTERSIYEMLQIVSISLTNATHLDALFAKPNYNIVNELDGYSEPTLF